MHKYAPNFPAFKVFPCLPAKTAERRMRISTRNLDTLFPKNAQKIEASADEKSGWLTLDPSMAVISLANSHPHPYPYFIRSPESLEDFFPSPAAEKPKDTNEDPGIETTSFNEGVACIPPSEKEIKMGGKGLGNS